MWEIIVQGRIWILIISGTILAISFFLGERIRSRILKAVPEQQKAGYLRDLTRASRIIEIVTSALVLFSLILIALYLVDEEGKHIVTLEKVQEWILEHGTRILVILIIGIVMWYGLKKFLPPLVRRGVSSTGESLEEAQRRESTLLSVFLNAGKIAIILLVVFMILSELTIPYAPIIASFGVAFVSVGFGAQYLVRDLIAGIFVIMENQYRVGDVVNIAGIGGLVEEVNLRKTVLRDLDGVVHHVPNGEIKVASNLSRQFARVNLDITVTYDTSLDRVISIINGIGEKIAQEEQWCDRIITPPQVLRVNNLSESGVEFKILGDVKPLAQWDVAGELRLRLIKAFEAEGIEIAPPRTKVYYQNTPPPGASGR